MQGTGLLRAAGALLAIVGLLTALLGIAKLPTGVAADLDTLYAFVDLLGGLATVYAGWLAFRTIPAALARGTGDVATARDVFAAPLVTLIVGIAEVTAFATYGLGSWTGITGVVTLVLSIPLWMTYRMYEGTARQA